MRIPKKIQFEGHVWDVVWVNGKDFKDKNGLTYADTDKSKLRVRLRKGCKRTVMEETFFHEIVHICDSETHPMNHKLVDDLARRLYAFFKNNKMLKEK